LGEVEGCRPRDGERGTYVAGGIADHEGGFAGGEGGGGDYEVAFVLAGGGVEDYYEFVICWGVLENSNIEREHICDAKRGMHTKGL
jgi:hypothetical protein